MVSRKGDLNLRERLVMNARARALLQRLIDHFALWGPPNKHFKGSHASQEVMPPREAMDKAERRQLAVMQLSGSQPARSIGAMRVKMARFLELAYTILENLAKGRPVPTAALDSLTDILREHSYSR